MTTQLVSMADLFAFEVPAEPSLFAGARLEREVRRTTRVVTWAARNAENQPVAVHMPLESAHGVELDAFVDTANRLAKLSQEDKVTGVAVVLSVAENSHAFQTPLCEIGTARDLPVLGWSLDRITSFFRRLVSTVEKLHARSMFLGCLSPDDVLVDDDLNPVLMWAGTSASAHGQVAASDGKLVPPELERDGTPDMLTDVYTLGRLLEVLVAEWIATTSSELAAEMRAILSKATALLPSLRFQNLEDLLASVDEMTARTSDSALMVRSAGRRRLASSPGNNQRASFGSLEQEASGATLHIGWIALGIGGVAACCALSAVVPLTPGARSALAYAVSALFGVAAASFSTPARWAHVARVMFGFAAAWLALFIDPTAALAERAAARRLGASNEHTRSAEIARRLDRPRADLGGLDLRGFDLSGRKIVDASFRRTDLRGANLRGTTLQSSDVAEADMTGAILDGAVLTGLDVVATHGFASARCSSTTALPNGWLCEESHPARDRGAH